MQRKGIKLAHAREVMMRRAAGTHVVLGVNFEPTDVRAGRQDVLIVLGLETDPGASRDRCMRPGGGSADLPDVWHEQPRPVIGSSEPLRVLPSGSVTEVEAQVPFLTSFQPCGSKSTFDVPAQELEPSAAQSFWPARQRSISTRTVGSS